MWLSYAKLSQGVVGYIILCYITIVPHSNPIKSPYIPILIRRNTILSLMSSLKIPEQSRKNRIKSH